MVIEVLFFELSLSILKVGTRGMLGIQNKILSLFSLHRNEG